MKEAVTMIDLCVIDSGFCSFSALSLCRGTPFDPAGMPAEAPNEERGAESRGG